MANKLRNEASIELAGKKILLRPTFGCLIEIESRTGKSIMELVTAIESAKLSIKDTIIVYEEGTKAADAPLTSSEIESLITDAGIVDVQTSTVEFFAKALFTGDKQVKEADDKKKEKVTT